jgi:hypothetical protein
MADAAWGRKVIHRQTVQATGSLGSDLQLFNFGQGYALPVLTHAGQITAYSLVNVAQGFFPGFTLGMASRQSRTAGYYKPVFVMFQCDDKFHLAPRFGQ